MRKASPPIFANAGVMSFSLTCSVLAAYHAHSAAGAAGAAVAAEALA